MGLRCGCEPTGTYGRGNCATCEDYRARRRATTRKSNQRPKAKERLREYQRGYRQRPGVKERERERNRVYQQRPEFKERKREYDRARGLSGHISFWNAVCYRRKKLRARLAWEEEARHGILVGSSKDWVR